MINRYRIRGKRAPIPTVSTRKVQTQPLDYTKGWHDGFPNDLQPEKTLRVVKDSRFNGVGKYQTRKGCDRYSVPIGETNFNLDSDTTGASHQDVTTDTWQARYVTFAASGVLTKAELNLKHTGAIGVLAVEIWSDDSGEVGTMLAQSSISLADIGTSYAYVPCYFMNPPYVESTTKVWLVAYLQDGGSGTVNWSANALTTNSDVSTDGGQTWSDTSYALNYKIYGATEGKTRGITRVYRPDGTPQTFLAFDTKLYKVSDINGSVTQIDTGLPSSDEPVRFEFVNDTLYYTIGTSKPRKYDWSTASEVATFLGTTATNLVEHVGLMFYFDGDDTNTVWFSNFGEYEVFTSTDFLTVPAPNSSDKPVAMAKLNGALYFWTKANKFQLLGTDNATFNLSEAYAQKGTFSQESVAVDNNNAYFASDDGIYQFNGTYEKNIAENIINTYTAILSKDSMVLELHDNKLYVWYTPNGEATNSECLVYNTLYGVWESLDTNARIGKSFARHDTTDLFLQASDLCGAIYYGERDANDYNNLGAPLEFEAGTAYEHFGAVQQLKRIPYWRPVLNTVDGDYSIQCGFAADYSDDFNYTSVALQASGFTYDDPASLYDAITYAGSNGVVYPYQLSIFGYGYRWKRSYRHVAAREPVEFAGEVLQIETKRLR